MHDSRAVAEQRLAEIESIYDSAPIGLAVLDTDLRFVRVNERLAEINGVPAALHIGRTVQEIVPDIARQAESLLRRIIDTGEPVLDIEVTGETSAHPGIERIWKESWLPLKGSTGRVVALNIVVEEVTEQRALERRLATLLEREHAARTAAEAAALRAKVLADASRLLSSSLDYDVTLAELARLVVPSLADWCAIYLARKDGTIRRITPRHDAATRRLDEALAQAASRLIWHRDANGITATLMSGKSVSVPEITREWLDTAIAEEEYRRAVAELAPTSLMIVPLVVRGLPLGGMIFTRRHPGPRYTPDDLVFAEDIAARAALAVDNARLLRQLRLSMAEAQDASRAKDEFLAMLAHELRNPLGAITIATTVLDRLAPPDDVAARPREIIKRQTNHLTRLMDDLLDVARVTTGRIVLVREPTDLAASVERCVGMQREAGRLDRHAVDVRVDRLWVNADSTRLDQVITNLLENAIKYTPEGGEIRVRVTREGASAVLRVQDTGIGIAADLLPRIFELFAQGERGLDRRPGGLGVGLTLARRLVDLHGGRIDAASDGPGRGSEFTVRLPCIEPPRSTQAGPGSAPARGTSAARRKVLIVEDNADGRQMLGMLLAMDGYEVHQADDAESGLALAMNIGPDAVLIDIGLPGIDGYELARRLRTRAPRLQLIAVTGYGQPEDRQRAIEAGFERHLVKPVTAEELRAALEGP